VETSISPKTLQDNGTFIQALRLLKDSPKSHSLARDDPLILSAADYDTLHQLAWQLGNQTKTAG
jgi:hypothetical protein